MAYAEKTEIAVSKSLAELSGMLRKAGADNVTQLESNALLAVQFQMQDRLIRFRVTIPAAEDMPARNGRNQVMTLKERQARADQVAKARARALLLVVKAKLESMESGIETFEQAFLANVVMANGETVHDRVGEMIALEYKTGAVQPTSTLFLSGPGR